MQAAREFRKGFAAVAGEADEKLEAASNELIQTLINAVAVLLERITTMEGVLEQVLQRKEHVRHDTAALHNDCIEKQRQAAKTVEATADNIESLHRGRKAADERRHSEREAFAQQVATIQDENIQLDAQIKELLAKMHANEAELRELKAQDREQEDGYQRGLAADNQRLGTMAGCLDEMQNFECAHQPRRGLTSLRASPTV